MAWVNGWGVWIWSDTPQVDYTKNHYTVPYGQNGATNTTPPTTGPNGTSGNPGQSPANNTTGGWVRGWGFWYYSPSGDINDPKTIVVYDGQNGATATIPPQYAPGSAPPSSAPVSTPSTPTSTTDPALAASAKGILDSFFGNLGLQSLSSWAWAKWQKGESVDEIEFEMYQTPEFNQRFPAYQQLAKEGQAMSPGAMIQYEQLASGIFKAAGLPKGFYDQPSDFASFMINNVSTAELQTRVQTYQQAAFTAPQAIRDELQNLYGVTPGQLTAFFIDPNVALPIIQKEFAASQAAGYSDLTGFGSLSKAQAEQVGNMGLSDQQLSQQFGTLAGLNPLFSPLQGTTEQGIDKQTALDASFGNNAADQAAIEQRKQERLSQFQGGGGPVATQAGVLGAGAAR